jgi:hypothetical protein
MSPASKCSLRWDPPISAGSCRWNAAVRVREEKAARTTGKPEHDANLMVELSTVSRSLL